MMKIRRYYQRIRWLFDNIKLRWIAKQTCLLQIERGDRFLKAGYPQDPAPQAKKQASGNKYRHCIEFRIAL